MTQRRPTTTSTDRTTTLRAVAVRLAAVLATTGIIVVGAVTAPAQADTGWNRQFVPTKPAHP